MQRNLGQSLYTVKMRRSVETDKAYISSEEVIDADLLHRRFGHPCPKYTEATANLYKVKLSGKFSVCGSCAYGKAKRNNVKKFTNSRTSQPYERIFIDTSSLPQESLGGSKYWIMIVDDATRYKWSFFRNSKDCIAEMLDNFLMRITNQGHLTKFLRCDNAGENIVLHCGYYPIAPSTP